MNASQILDVIEAKYSNLPLLREISTIDEQGVMDNNLRAVEVAEAMKRAPRVPDVRRIDGLMFDGPQRTAIEVKVTVADSHRESWAKVWPWKRLTHRFIYATPAGLIEHPPVWGCGLWWIHDDGKVEIVRKASINKYPEPLPNSVITNLAYRAAGKAQITPPTIEGGAS